VHFIQKVNALNGDIVVFCRYDISIVFEFLDIDHCDLWLAKVVVDELREFDILAKCLARATRIHSQAAAGEFTLCLNQQVERVDDEIKFGNDLPPLEVIT
jgi:hypothetical protein